MTKMKTKGVTIRKFDAVLYEEFKAVVKEDYGLSLDNCLRKILTEGIEDFLKDPSVDKMIKKRG
jgi:hypothetical protein